MELYCIDCKKNIKKDSKEHDNCILINDGEDLVCEDCGYTDDEYEWECQCGCGKEVPFTRSYTEDKVIQVEEQEYWLKECAIQKLGISEDICIECYQRPCNCSDSEDFINPPFKMLTPEHTTHTTLAFPFIFIISISTI